MKKIKNVFLCFIVLTISCQSRSKDEHTSEPPLSNENLAPSPVPAEEKRAPADMGKIIEAKLTVRSDGDDSNSYLYLTSFDKQRNDSFMHFERAKLSFGTGFNGPSVEVKTIYLNPTCRADDACGVISLNQDSDLEDISTGTLSESLKEKKFIDSRSLVSLENLNKNPETQIFTSGTVWLVRSYTRSSNSNREWVKWVQTIAMKVEDLSTDLNSISFRYKVLEYKPLQ